MKKLERNVCITVQGNLKKSGKQKWAKIHYFCFESRLEFLKSTKESSSLYHLHWKVIGFFTPLSHQVHEPEAEFFKTTIRANYFPFETSNKSICTPQFFSFGRILRYTIHKNPRQVTFPGIVRLEVFYNNWRKAGQR